jgi:hypothetical protein
VINEALNKIDANGNQALAAEMSEQVAFMEDVITDAVRSKVGSQAQMHELASSQAQALAHMAWKDDLYNAEKSRFETELSINAQIEDKKNQVSAAEAEMNRAIAERNRSFDTEQPSPEVLWSTALEDYFESIGIDPIKGAEMRANWDKIIADNPEALSNFEAFKGELMFSVNQKNMQAAGVWNQFNEALARYEPEAVQLIRDFMMTNDITKGYPNSHAGSLDVGSILGADGTAALQGLTSPFSLDSPQYSSLLDVWSHHKTFIENYDPTPQQVPHSGSQASNNLANRNHPDYAYRRDVVVPFMANEVLAKRFPGIEFGGVHFNGSRVSRGMNIDRAGSSNPNSDHVSGGAMDLYFKAGTAQQTDQKLREIANWLRLQPWASLVVYENDNNHQTGTNNAHVHISFPVGYRIS